MQFINQFSSIPPIKIFFRNICTTVISFSSTKKWITLSKHQEIGEIFQEVNLSPGGPQMSTGNERNVNKHGGQHNNFGKMMSTSTAMAC